MRPIMFFDSDSNGSVLDLDHVIYVAHHGDSNNWKRPEHTTYVVYLTSGAELEIYEFAGMHPHMPRKEFIRRWVGQALTDSAFMIKNERAFNLPEE